MPFANLMSSFLCNDDICKDCSSIFDKYSHWVGSITEKIDSCKTSEKIRWVPAYVTSIWTDIFTNYLSKICLSSSTESYLTDRNRKLLAVVHLRNNSFTFLFVIAYCIIRSSSQTIVILVEIYYEWWRKQSEPIRKLIIS